MAQSFGCRRCYGEDPRRVWAYYEKGLAVERELVFEPHFIVQLRRCSECGQQFVWIFSEEGGEDAQRREIAPVSADETEALSNLDFSSFADLDGCRRHLVTEWPTNASEPAIEWVTGELRLPGTRLG